jgi:hypothetical protein
MAGSLIRCPVLFNSNCGTIEIYKLVLYVYPHFVMLGVKYERRHKRSTKDEAGTAVA